MEGVLFIILGAVRLSKKRVLDIKCLFRPPHPAAYALNGIRITVEVLAVTLVNVRLKCPFLSYFSHIGMW
jgi:hypothetical protein